MIPTTPWEAPFRGIALWLGISDSNMDEVCPNLPNFNSSHLIEVDEMFDSVSNPGSIECIDSSLMFRTKTSNGQYIWRTCRWVKAKNAIQRCALVGVSSLCAKTCGTCNICHDSVLKIRFRNNKRWVTSKCQWYTDIAKDPSLCDTIDGLEDTCRKSCNKCRAMG